MKKIIPILTILFCFALTVPLNAQKTAFTIADAINVKSFGSQTLSPDGNFLAGIISDGRARFGTDHFRFRDPSYLNIRAGELVIMDTRAGKEIRPFDAPVRIAGLTWNAESNILAFFQQKGEKLVLSYYDTGSRKVKDVKLKDDRSFATNSDINFKAGKAEVIVRMREKGWMEKAMAEYVEATTGPVVVYDGSKDFLKWDKIGVTSGLTELVEVKLSSGKTRNILPESSYGSVNVSEDGQYLVYDEVFRLKTTYNRNSGTEYQTSFRKIDSSDSSTVIYERNKRRRRFSWDPSGKHFAYVDSGNVYIGNIETIAGTPAVNITKGKAFEDEEKKKAVKFSVQSWDSKSERLLLSSKGGWWITDKSGDKLEQVYELPEEDEEKKKLPNRNVAKWGDDGNYIYVSYSEKDQWKRGIQRFNIRSGEFEDLMTNSHLYGSWRFSKSGEVITYNKSDGDKPNNVFLNNRSFDAEKQLTDLNPWVKDKKWTKSELITYRNVDGNEMKGVLYYPVDYDPGKKYPLVLEVYETFFNNGYRSSMNLIANQGYFGLRPSVELEQGYPGEAWMKGVTSAINKLVEEGKVDNDKVGVHGTSYGGYATSLLITQTDRFAAAINISGKVNIISFLGDSPKIGTRNYAAAEVGQDRIGGSFWDEPLKYFQTSAVFFADRIKTPHLLLSGEGDWNVPGTNTRELYYAMRRLGKDVTWVNYMRGGHGAGWASVESDYHDQWNRMFEFYDKYFYTEKAKQGEDKATEADQKNQ